MNLVAKAFLSFLCNAVCSKKQCQVSLMSPEKRKCDGEVSQ